MFMGVVMVLGGLSGTLVLRGTGSSGLLALLGVVLFVVGLMQLGANAGGETSSSADFSDPERDAEQWAEYERSKRAVAEKIAAAKAKATAAARPIEDQTTSDLIAATPGAKERIDAIVAAAGSLTAEQILALRADLAQRLHAEQHASAS